MPQYGNSTRENGQWEGSDPSASTGVEKDKVPEHLHTNKHYSYNISPVFKYIIACTKLYSSYSKVVTT